MLSIRGLQKSFGGVKATDNVTLDFADGSLTAVIGPNGAGKSTFFNLITGALKPDAGQILLNDVDLAGRTPPDIVRHGIVLGIVILFFAIGLRKGLMDFVVEWYARRRAGTGERS